MRVRILQWLAENGEANSTSLARELRIALFGVQNQFHRLEKAGLLLSRKRDRARFYSFNPKNPLLPEILALLRKSLPSNGRGKRGGKKAKKK